MKSHNRVAACSNDDVVAAISECDLQTQKKSWLISYRTDEAGETVCDAKAEDSVPITKGSSFPCGKGYVVFAVLLRVPNGNFTRQIWNATKEVSFGQDRRHAKSAKLELSAWEADEGSPLGPMICGEHGNSRLKFILFAVSCR